MSKAIALFITSIIFIVSLGVSGVSAYGMGLNDNQRDSPAYKAALSFLIISIFVMFISMMTISYHSTKLYCE